MTSSWSDHGLRSAAWRGCFTRFLSRRIPLHLIALCIFALDQGRILFVLITWFARFASQGSTGTGPMSPLHAGKALS